MPAQAGISFYNETKAIPDQVGNDNANEICFIDVQSFFF